MSSIVNKVKEAVSGHKHSDHSEPEGTHGHHNNRAANAADPRIDSDRDGRADPTVHGSHGSGLTGSHGTHGTTGSGLTGTHGTTGYNTSTNAGPHDSNAANKLDPRVDSDRDGSRTAGGNTYGSSGVTGTHGTTGSGLTGTHGTHGTTGSGLTGSHGTHGTTGYNSSTNAGPHNSNALNAADPRVDSDRDGSRTVGGNNYGSSGLTGTHGTHGTTGSGLTGSHGTHGTTGSGLTGTHGTTGYNSSTNAGPHDSNAANKLDPRVDSDRDGSRTAGGNTYGSSGVTGTHGTHNTHGTHGVTGAHTGPGPAPNTAGPHKSDALNKIDPRVDSDRDGSKTLGQDKTYSADAHKDPTDAAQVPPSTLRKHIGEPSIAHDDHHHGRERRNSSVTAQESHRGL